MPQATRMVQLHNELCQKLKLIHEVAEEEAEQHHKKGKVKAAREAEATARRAKADAKKWGCRWAQA